MANHEWPTDTCIGNRQQEVSRSACHRLVANWAREKIESASMGGDHDRLLH